MAKKVFPLYNIGDSVHILCESSSDPNNEEIYGSKGSLRDAKSTYDFMQIMTDGFLRTCVIKEVSKVRIKGYYRYSVLLGTTTFEALEPAILPGTTDIKSVTTAFEEYKKQYRS